MSTVVGGGGGGVNDHVTGTMSPAATISVDLSPVLKMKGKRCSFLIPEVRYQSGSP